MPQLVLDTEIKLTQIVYLKAKSYNLNQIRFNKTELNAQKVYNSMAESITHKKVIIEFNEKSIKK